MPWYTKASLPAARYWAAGYDISGIGYVVGGNSGSGAVRQNYAYNPASDTWTTKAQLPSSTIRVSWVFHTGHRVCSRWSRYFWSGFDALRL
jgi:hypothetical protein